MEIIQKRVFEIERTSFALLKLFQEMNIGMEAGFDRISGRINSVERNLIDQISILNERVDSVERNLTEQISLVNEKVDSVENNLTEQIRIVRVSSIASVETLNNRIGDLIKELLKIKMVTNDEGNHENTMIAKEGMKARRK